MVKVKIKNGIVGYDANRGIIVNLIADTKAEVKNNDEEMEVVGMPEGYTNENIAMESIVITAAGDIGLMQSTGEWHWVGDEEDTRSVASLAKSAPAETKEAVDEKEPIEEEQTEEDDMR